MHNGILDPINLFYIIGNPRLSVISENIHQLQRDPNERLSTETLMPRRNHCDSPVPSINAKIVFPKNYINYHRNTNK